MQAGRRNTRDSLMQKRWATEGYVYCAAVPLLENPIFASRGGFKANPRRTAFSEKHKCKCHE